MQVAELNCRCQSLLKIMVCRKENNVFLANVMFLKFMYTSHRSGTIAFIINFTVSPIMPYILQMLC